MKKTTSLTKRVLINSVTAGVLTTLALTAMPAQANNPAPRIKADAPNRYTVKKGDTLWDISGKYLQSPSRWKQIWATNKQISNPHLIYPGDILIMCIIKGKTLVGIDTGEGCAGVEKQVTGQMQPKAVRVTSASNSIPVIPLQSIRHWLNKITIVNPVDFETTPYVLASKNRNIITSEGDKIYVKGVPLQVKQTYGVYRQGQPYVDPRTQTPIGQETEQVALGVVTDVAPNGVSTIKLTETYGKEVREGDRVFAPMGNVLPPFFNLQPANVSRPGRVIRVVDSVGQAGTGSIIAMNLGFTNGAKVGDVLTVYQKGLLVRDVFDDDSPVRLPSEPIGKVMIFRTFNNISYGYVLNTENPIKIGDQLTNPQNM